MDTSEDMDGRKTLAEEEGELEIAKAELKASELAITRLEAELAQIQTEKSELQKKAMQLSEAAQLVKDAAAAADEDVASAMLRAEEAVAMEVKEAERVSDTEIALQKAETLAESTSQADAAVLQVDISEDLPQQVSKTANGPLLEIDDYIILQKVKQGGEGGLGVVSPEALEKVGETTQEDGHVLQFQD
jgi:chromosome segregation ATPase